ncbi:MAG: hypothetical protein E7576_07120 [Ruminococcaceae bacterium]|nr:hypothetical protein [Oscillospiraceae bacterium]
MGKFLAGCAVGFAGASVLAAAAAKKIFEDETFGYALRSSIVMKATGFIRDLVYGRERLRKRQYCEYVDYSRDGRGHGSSWPGVETVKEKETDKEKPHSVFQKFDILGLEALYSEERGELEAEAQGLGYTEGEDFYIYWLRGGKGDDPGEIASVEQAFVAVNYVATVMTKEPISFPEGRNWMDLSENDWGFLSDEGDITVFEFLGD